MKTLRMFGMAMVAIVMGVSLASCSKDENPDGDNQSKEKKLTKMVAVIEGGVEVGYIFTYDNNGKLNEAQYKDCYWSYTNGVPTGVTPTIYTCQYAWSGDIINATHGNGKSVFNQETGLIESVKITTPYSTKNYTYTYSSDRIAKIEEDNGNLTEVTWNGDKLMKNSKLIYDGTLTEDDTYTITSYTGTCKKGYCPLIPEMIESAGSTCLLYMAHPELIGSQTTQLPTSRTHYYPHYFNGEPEHYTMTTDITYEFAEDGYISKINIANHYSDGNFEDDSLTYILTWE